LKEKRRPLDAIDLAVDGYDEGGHLKKLFETKLLALINAKKNGQYYFVVAVVGDPTLSRPLSLHKTSYKAARRGMVGVLWFPRARTENYYKQGAPQTRGGKP
jgi:hypothetical protein